MVEHFASMGQIYEEECLREMAVGVVMIMEEAWDKEVPEGVP